MADDLTDAISDAATSPSEVEADGLRVKARSINEMIAADDHVKAATAAQKPPFGLRLTQIIPGGAV